MRYYVVHMQDEGNGCYYLTEDKALFEKVETVSSNGEDEDLMEFMNDNEKEFEVVYTLAGITVIDQVTGYFY